MAHLFKVMVLVMKLLPSARLISLYLPSFGNIFKEVLLPIGSTISIGGHVFNNIFYNYVWLDGLDIPINLNADIPVEVIL